MREPFTKLYVHLVWATWDRLPLVRPELEALLASCIRVEAETLGAEVLAIGGVEDHIHALVRVPATISISALVQRIKGSSSHLATHVPGAPDFFKWQGDYGASAVSAWDVRRLQTYIRNQRHHHEAGTLSATLERIERP